MTGWKRRLTVCSIALILFGIIGIALCLLFVHFVVDLLWFHALHYESYFLLRLFYRYLVLTVATLIFFSIFFFNFWIASRYLGAKLTSSSGTGEGSRKAYQDFIKMFRSGSLKMYTPLSLVLAVAVAFPLFEKWETALFYIFGPMTGVHDPYFGKDVSYFLFSFPIYILLQHRLLIAFSILFAALLFLYWLEHRLLSGENLHLPRGAKRHLSVVIFFIILIQGWGYILQRHGLVYNSSHESLFFGPGYVETWIVLPLIWLCLLLFMAMASSFAYFIHTRKRLKIVILLAVLYIGVTGLRYWPYLPNTVQKYIVKPNEITREKPYIEANIKATLAAYKLDQVEMREFETGRIPWTVTPNVKHMIHNIPVWDRDVLNEVYEQLQGIRPYYIFATPDVDRYTVGGLYQQVYVAAREMNTSKIPSYAKSWVNIHLQYTHGNGVVMTPAAQAGDEFMVWFVQDIPPISRYGFNVKQPGVYYGLEKYPFVIAPNNVGEFDYPKGQVNVLSDYQGKGDIPLSSYFRKLLFAVFFRDKNIFFTTKTNSKSRILFRRNIYDRISTLTPFLSLDSDPYIVVTSKRLYWLEDAYTTSDWYPYSEPYKGQFNYIRDSVKIVIDAYNGSVTFYIADPTDPIIQAYRRMYPGLFKPLDQMPPEIRSHIRYPRDFFKYQMAIYGKYHQTDPELFYRQEDIWDFGKIYRDKKTIPIRPYYLTLNLFQPDRSEFLLFSPMSPKNRDNERALAVAGCDGDNYGKIVVYSFSTEEQVYGPSQVDALIDQDTNIAKQFTLWNQIGSEIIRGRMILMPVDGVILYIEPLYLRAATRLRIPELKRLIVSQGDVVVMEPSLEEAFASLEAISAKRTERLEKRFPIHVPKKRNLPEKKGHSLRF